MATQKKKPGMLKRLFSSKKLDVSGLTEEDKKKFQRSKSMDAAMMRQTRLSESDDSPKINKGKKGSFSEEPSAGPSTAAQEKAKEAARERQNGQKPKGKGKAARDQDTSKRRAKTKTKKKVAVQVTADDPIDFPCTPEVILEHHKLKPSLNPTEEWLVVELGEFECLIDSMEIIKIMAKHSKFFEVEPDELVEEFFEFVDDVPSYDEVVNYDVWQEFRDKKYLC